MNITNKWKYVQLTTTPMSDKELIKMLKSEINWYRTYGEFINVNYSTVDAEASAYADGDKE